MNADQEVDDEEKDELDVARQRDAELDADPSIGLTMDEFKAAIER